jgi:mannose-1-phosphate guanylyltransferase
MVRDSSRYAVIMAGGWGDRFWPLSRPSRPKPVLRIGDRERSFLEEILECARRVVPREGLLIATGASVARAIRSVGIDLPSDGYIVEPAKRDTAGCVVFVLASLLARGAADDAVVGFLTSDNVIGGVEGFQQGLEAAYLAAGSDGRLVCLGIRPSRPDTAFGYIEVADGAGHAEPGSVVSVGRFTEKPDAETASELAASGRHFWNSGMLIGRIGIFLAEMARHAPELHRAVHSLREAMAAGDENRVTEVFQALKPVSIDYALLEKADLGMVVADFDWETLNGWDALDRLLTPDDAGNVVVGDPLLIDASDSVVYVDPAAAGKSVAVVGATGLVVVVTDDAVLVVPKDRAQEVKAAVRALRQ